MTLACSGIVYGALGWLLMVSIHFGTLVSLTAFAGDTDNSSSAFVVMYDRSVLSCYIIIPILKYREGNDVYLRPLINDLRIFWASQSGWSGQGYKACPTCNEDTLSTRVLDKTTYVGYKRFLKKPHKWRRSLDFNGEIKDEDPPRKFDRDSIMAQLARFPTRAKGKHPMKGIDQHLGKIYTDSKSTLKRDYWVKNPDDETYDCAQNARNRAKSTVACRQGSQTLATLRDRQMQSSATQEYPSLIQTFFDTHTVGDVFLRDEDRCLYEEMLRLHGLGTYTDDQIMAKVRWGKQRRHIPDVSRVLAGRGKDVLDVPVPRCNHTFDVNELKKCNKQLQKQINMITKAMSSDDMYSQLFTQLQSQHESESGSKSGAAGDDESGNDEDADEDEEDADS
ncbi:RNA-directed DNA polymerase, eukaryota, reverse transcriptase zinc-binding domain protein [Tanacetum coccineum]